MFGQFRVLYRMVQAVLEGCVVQYGFVQSCFTIRFTLRAGRAQEEDRQLLMRKTNPQGEMQEWEQVMSVAKLADAAEALNTSDEDLALATKLQAECRAGWGGRWQSRMQLTS